MALSPISISIPWPTRNSEANYRKRTKNHVYDPKMESSGLVENDLPNNKNMPNLPFSTESISPPPQRVVTFNKRQYWGGGEKVGRKDLMRVAVPDKNSGGLWAISQAATRYGETGEALAITEPSGRLGPNTRQQTGKIMTNGHKQTLASRTSVIAREKSVEEFRKIEKSETGSRIHKKPRFLCLHGLRMSAGVLQTQLIKRWPEALLGKLDLVFPNGPYLAQRKSDIEDFYDPPFYEWFQYSQDYQEVFNFDNCVAYIEDYMIKHGPFDGLMGFSQGAVISATLPGLQSQGLALTKVPKMKYVILMSGGKFGGSVSKFACPKLAANAFSSPVQCPSLHIIGETDYLKESGIELLDSFVDPVVINHPRGHTVAKLDEKGQKTMLSFIEKIEKM
ncbi:hypothetical protein RHSIM_RhsimUnG0200500 [Rhododendron simsii]|uniref:Serine hydrolase domain-containing protein n=1 Tax=Rhododendron simsii TaxID=118357 RepID=A0A834FVS9_RHOSS|nr:hypothetical protein RHSIM_RhsimUnG0200500 [Rhododendron simsii]